MCHFFNIHSTTDEHLDCFIETVNPFHWNTVLLEQCHNIQEGADDIVFISFGYILRNGIAGNYIFNFFRDSTYCFP